MNFEQYAPLALRTAKPSPSGEEGDLSHAALGLITEVGEFTTLVKRWVIYDRPMTSEDLQHALEELGDVQWYVPLALRGLAVPLGVFVEAVEISRFSFPKVSTFEQLALTMGWMAGEVASCALDYKRDSKPMALRALSAMGAIVCCCDEAARMLGVQPGQVRTVNINKLRVRFPTAYSDSAAEARADKGGLDARQS